MEQRSPILPQKPSLPKEQRYFLIAVGIVVAALGVGAVIFLSTSGALRKPTPTETPNEPRVTSPEATSANRRIYLGIGSAADAGLYRLIDLETGTQREFIPAGYTIPDQRAYDVPFPKFLILQKETALYTYDLENKILTLIPPPVAPPALLDNKEVRELFETGDPFARASEVVEVFPSITDKNRFLIILATWQAESFRSDHAFLLNAATNETTLVLPPPAIEECMQYDSNNQRLFSWPCGGGAPVMLPLRIRDLAGKVVREVLTPQDFDLASAEGWITLSVTNAQFLITPQDMSKIIVVDPRPSEPRKTTYMVNEEVRQQARDTIAFEATRDEEQKTIAIGDQHRGVLLLRFDDKNQIIQHIFFSDAGAFPNYQNTFLSYGEKLYYYHMTGDFLRVINLNTWQVEKSIPASESLEPITYFALPD